MFDTLRNYIKIISILDIAIYPVLFIMFYMTPMLDTCINLMCFNPLCISSRLCVQWFSLHQSGFKITPVLFFTNHVDYGGILNARLTGRGTNL